MYPAQRAATGVVALAFAAGLAGCGLSSAVSMTPHLSATGAERAGATAAAAPSNTGPVPSSAVSSSPVSSSAVPSSAASDSARAVTGRPTSPSASPRTPGDLDTGSVTHTLPAGADTLVVDYWTSQSAATWTSATSAVIQLSAHLESTTPAAKRPAVKITRFTARLTDGSRSTSLADDRGDFVLTPPYTYGSALQLPGSGGPDRMAVVTTQFDLLVETSPGSGAFFRQTVVDSLHLSFQPEERP